MKTKFPNLRHLRAFCEVGRSRGISAAAGSVFMSQPAITQALAGLEQALGEELFERRPEGMFLTPAGQMFHARIIAVFDLLREGAQGAMRAARKRPPSAASGFETRVTAAQLRALVAIEEAGSFNQAARQVGVKQPSLHRAARDLEKLSGLTLFTPEQRGIALTASGEVFARATRLAWAEIQQGYAELAARQGQDVSRIVVGSMPLSRSAILPDATHAMLQEFPHIQLRNIDGPYSELLRGLRYGDIDLLIGALRDPAPVEDVVQQRLFDDPLSLVVGPHHPLAARTRVQLNDTMAFPWIAPPVTTPAGRYLYRMLKIDQLPQTPVRVVSSSMIFVRELLLRGDYITIMSRSQIRDEREKAVMVSLDMELPDSRRSIGLTMRRGWKPTATQARFIGLIKQATEQTIAKTNGSTGL